MQKTTLNLSLEVNSGTISLQYQNEIPETDNNTKKVVYLVHVWETPGYGYLYPLNSNGAPRQTVAEDSR